jgi:pSer/pThr/pTyr-binding forkhead associated (FHA) protein
MGQMMFELFNPVSGRVYRLTGLIKEVGRGTSADISLPDDRKASRIHARLEKDGEDWVIVDLESTNRTFVNRESIKQKRLKHGDEVRIGDTLLIYRRTAEPASEGAEEATRVDLSLSDPSSWLRRILQRRKSQ